MIEKNSNIVNKTSYFFSMLPTSIKTVYQAASWLRTILTDVMTNIVVDKSTEHNKPWPRSIC